MTQVEMALDMLKRYEWISCLDFQKETGSMSLRARISDLENQGHKIERKWKTSVNMWGREIQFRLYKLNQPPKTLIEIMEAKQ